MDAILVKPAAFPAIELISYVFCPDTLLILMLLPERRAKDSAPEAAVMVLPDTVLPPDSCRLMVFK